MAKIQHIAVFSDDPEKLAEFYQDIYGMEITGRSSGDVWMTDGYMAVALLSRKHAEAPRGINHFGFTITEDEKAEIYRKQTERNLAPFDPRAANPEIVRPFVEDAAFDVDGNKFDLTTAGKRDNDEEAEKQEKWAADHKEKEKADA